MGLQDVGALQVLHQDAGFGQLSMRPENMVHQWQGCLEQCSGPWNRAARWRRIAGDAAQRIAYLRVEALKPAAILLPPVALILSLRMCRAKGHNDMMHPQKGKHQRYY